MYSRVRPEKSLPITDNTQTANANFGAISLKKENQKELRTLREKELSVK